MAPIYDTDNIFKRKIDPNLGMVVFISTDIQNGW